MASKYYTRRNGSKHRNMQHGLALDSYINDKCSFLHWHGLEEKHIKTVTVQSDVQGSRKPHLFLKVGTEDAEMCPLFREHGGDNFLVLRFPEHKCPPDKIMSLLKEGIRLKSKGVKKRYIFFGHSASQLRKRTCVMYDEKLGPLDEIVKKFGRFDNIKTVAKRASRIGLLLSNSDEHLQLEEGDIEWIPDIERNGYCFTDGCGMISPQAASVIAQNMGISSQYSHQGYKVPSVFQVRLMGCKGTLALDVKAKKKVALRMSLCKFEWTKAPPYCLGIVSDGVSRPYTVGSLNKQYIMLLSTLGICDSVFLKKQQTYFEDLQTLLTDSDTAFDYLCANEFFSEAEALLKEPLEVRKQRSNDHVVKKLQDLKKQSMKKMSKQVKRSGLKEEGQNNWEYRLQIPIRKSRNIFGICDQTGKLQYGQCFVQVTVNGQAEILQPGTKVVVVKCPCYFPGDIRILTCEDVPELHHLIDCIVFPTEGQRPHADEITGSDLDGDKFFVCWDEELIPEKEEDPCQFPSTPAPELDLITVDHMIEAFARYDPAIGILDSLYKRWADEYGIGSIECRQIAELIAKDVDAPKTGEKIKIPPKLRNVKQRVPTQAEESEKKDMRIWKKMESVAKIYKEAHFMSDSNVKSLTHDALEDVLSDRESRMTYFQRFRILYEWGEYENNKSIIKDLMPRINFSCFTKEQLKLIPLDVFEFYPKVQEELLLGDLSRSKILESNLAKEMFRTRLGSIWYRRYPAFHDIMDDDDESLYVVPWHLLKDVLQSPERKILLLEVDMGEKCWVVAVEIPIQVPLGDIVHMPECAGIMNASVYIPNTRKCKMELGKEYMACFSGNRLDLYTKNRHGTFIALRQVENTQETEVSIALDRMGIRRDDQIKMKKSRITRVEVFSECSSPDYHRHKAIFKSENSTKTLKEPAETGAPAGYKAQEDDFPPLQHSEPLPTKRSLQKAENELFKKSQALDEKVTMVDIQQYMDDFFSLPAYSAHVASVVSHYFDDEMGLYLENFEDYRKLIFALMKNEFHFTCVESLVENFRNTNNLDLKDQATFLREIMLKPDFDNASVMHMLQLIQTEGLPHPEGMEQNSYTYFCHWAVQITLELRHDIEESSIKARQVFPKNIVTVHADSMKKKDDNIICLEQNSQQKLDFDQDKEYIALSPVLEENDGWMPFWPQYIAQVVDSAGPAQDVTIAFKMGNPKPLHGKWRIDKFPSMLSYERMMSAVINLAECCGSDPIYGKIVKPGHWQNSGASLSVSFAQHAALNKNQLAALKMAQTEDISLIHGPPGTGKTMTAAKVIQSWLEEIERSGGKGKVLVTAETNEGVDNLIDKILEADAVLEGSIIRIGSYSTVRLQHHCFLPQEICKQGNRKKEKIIENARVVCATCIGSGATLLKESIFTHLLIDEAGQATEPTCLVLISKGCKKLCLIGDEKQLPPLVKSDRAVGLKVTLFERLKSRNFPCIMLDVQYRMHPKIRQFPSDNFYGGALKDGVVPQIFSWIEWPKQNLPVKLVNVLDGKESVKGTSKWNQAEVNYVKSLVNDLPSDCTKKHKIGILTPYTEQVKLLREHITNKDISIRTVDGFQGQECDLVIFSAVRANDLFALGFLTDMRRMNVMLTRARHGLVVVAHKATFAQKTHTPADGLSEEQSEGAKMWKKWVEWAEKEGIVQHINADGNKPAYTKATKYRWRKR